MRKIITLLVAAALFGGPTAWAFSHPTLAPTTATCWDGDCLSKGWTQVGPTSERFTESSCREGECASRGWIANGNAGLTYYVSCKESGCLTEGWYEVELYTQRLLREVSCEKDQCLKYGWTAYEKLTGASYRSECVKGDCKTQGWDTILPGYKLVTARCLNGDCFIHGWQEKP